MADVSKQFTIIDENNKKLNSKILADYRNNIDSGRKAVSDSKQLINYNNKLIYEIESMINMMNPDSKRENTYKLKSAKDDLIIKTAKVQKLEEKLSGMDNLRKIQQGNTLGMSQEEITKSTRDAAIDLNLKTDLHQDLINEIGKNLYSARDNLNTITVEVNKQDEQIDRIHGNVGDTQKVLGRTDKRITSMNRRVYCHKLLLNLLSFVLFISILVLLIIKLLK